MAAGGYRGVTDVPAGTGMGLGIEKKEPVWFPLAVEHSVGE